MANDEDVTHRLRGPIDSGALFAIRDEFSEMEPLSRVSVDDFVNPSVLIVEFTVGLLEDSTGRFDIQWTTEGVYKFHYTEATLDFRWGHHPHGGDYRVRGDAHFHPPPDASTHPDDVEASCFTVQHPKIVARGVLTNWHAAFHKGLNELNRPEHSG